VCEREHQKGRQVARVVDLERARVEQLANEFLPILRERGSIDAEVDGLESVQRWRRAARRAARTLGWSIRTGITPGGTRVWAASDDWPLPRGADRAAAERVAALIHGTPSTTD
jgi:hypothetical protein